MFNSIAFDVVIGLVFIYLLYSLLVSIVGEMISTWMAIRSRILRIAVERMLNDGYFGENGKKKHTDLISHIAKFFLKEFTEDFTKSFAGKFYDQPAIKYLTKGSKEDNPLRLTQTKPSYFSDEYFADAFLQLLKDKGAGDTDEAKIRFCLNFNTHHIQPETLKHLRSLLDDAKGDIPMFKLKIKTWYNEMMDRTNGWYKRKMQFILFWLGFIIAAAFNVNSIAIAKILANDKDARAQLVEMGVNFAKDSSKENNPFIHNDKDSLYPKEVIDTSYNRVMKDINAANLILGLGWNFDKMTKSKSAMVYRQHYNKVANNINKIFVINDYLRTIQASYDTATTLIRKNTDSLEIIKADTSLYQFLADTTIAKQKMDDASKKIISLQKEIDSLSKELKKDSLKLLSANKEKNKNLQIINDSLNMRFTDIDSLPYNITRKSQVLYVYGKEQYSLGDKISYIVSRSNPLTIPFWGWVITALMLSLGAPFWFDLLKKLVSLRGAGVNPDEKKKEEKKKNETTASESKASDKKVNDVIKSNEETSLNNFTQKVRNEKGIISIAIAYEDQSKMPYLMISTETKEVQEYLQNRYGEKEILDNGFNIPIKYTLENQIETHSGMSGSEIANDSLALGTGTLGCQLRKNGFDNNVYFISCWHVMKDNSNWDSHVLNNKIISFEDNKPKQLGEIEEGFLSHDKDAGIDIGIAKYNEGINISINEDFVIKAQFRDITSFDSLIKTKVKLYGKVCKLKEATIFHDKINAHIKYPDGNIYLMNDVFSIISVDAKTGGKVAPTSGGDSGAIVIDENGVPLGMVIGGNGNFSYAIKFSNVFGAGNPFKEYSFKF
jgi:hypothetical protein